MARRIIKGDLVKIISGDNKGKTAQVLSVDIKNDRVILDEIGKRTRHIKKSFYNPQGGKRDIQVGINISKVALVADKKSTKTSRVGYKIIDGKKNRVAKQLNDKAIVTAVVPTKKETK